MIKVHHFFENKARGFCFFLLLSTTYMPIVHASLIRILGSFVAGHVTCAYQIKELLKKRDDLKDKNLDELEYFIITESDIVNDVKKSSFAEYVKTFIRDQLKKDE